MADSRDPDELPAGVPRDQRPVLSIAANPAPVRQAGRIPSSLRRHPAGVRTATARITPPATKCVCNSCGSRWASAHRCMACMFARTRMVSPSRSATGSVIMWWVTRNRAKLSFWLIRMAYQPTCAAPVGGERRRHRLGVEALVVHRREVAAQQRPHLRPVGVLCGARAHASSSSPRHDRPPGAAQPPSGYSVSDLDTLYPDLVEE